MVPSDFVNEELIIKSRHLHIIDNIPTQIAYEPKEQQIAYLRQNNRIIACAVCLKQHNKFLKFYFRLFIQHIFSFDFIYM